MWGKHSSNKSEFEVDICWQTESDMHSFGRLMHTVICKWIFLQLVQFSDAFLMIFNVQLCLSVALDMYFWPKPDSIYVVDIDTYELLFVIDMYIYFEGAHVIIACRDLLKAERAAEYIRSASENERVEVRVVDLASLNSIRKFADEILKSQQKIHILINNAGMWKCSVCLLWFYATFSDISVI